MRVQILDWKKRFQMRRNILEEGKDLPFRVLITKRVKDEVVSGEEGVAVSWIP